MRQNFFGSGKHVTMIIGLVYDSGRVARLKWFVSVITQTRAHFTEQNYVELVWCFTCPPENGTPIKNNSFCFAEWHNLTIFFGEAIVDPKLNLRIIIGKLMVMNLIIDFDSFVPSLPLPPHTFRLTRPIPSRSLLLVTGRPTGSE